MKNDFIECQYVLFDATSNVLRESSPYINSIERTARGDLPVTGLSLDLYPWHGAITLSLRLSSDFPLGENRYEIGDWKYHDFPSAWKTTCFQEAGHFLQRFYRAGGQDEFQARAHLVFLAGAEVLLDPRIAEQLQSLGIDAPIKTEYFISHYFEYIVLDSDETVKANYCEIVMANRVTNLLLGG
jgi:hypothetical protein